MRACEDQAVLRPETFARLRVHVKTKRSVVRGARERSRSGRPGNGHVQEGQGTVLFRKARDWSWPGRLWNGCVLEGQGTVVFRKAREWPCSGRPGDGRVLEGQGTVLFRKAMERLFPGKPGNDGVREFGSARDKRPIRMKHSVLGY